MYSGECVLKRSQSSPDKFQLSGIRNEIDYHKQETVFVPSKLSCCQDEQDTLIIICVMSFPIAIPFEVLRVCTDNSVSIYESQR